MNWTEPTCADCHVLEDPGDNPPAVPDATCLGCHGRQNAEINNHQAPDVHRDDENFTCMDCHTTDEMHGDGTTYDTMFDSPDMGCQTGTCHQTIPTNRAHTEHQTTVDCSACHMKASLSCVNCHFETEVQGGG